MNAGGEDKLIVPETETEMERVSHIMNIALHFRYVVRRRYPEWVAPKFDAMVRRSEAESENYWDDARERRDVELKTKLSNCCSWSIQILKRPCQMMRSL